MAKKNSKTSSSRNPEQPEKPSNLDETMESPIDILDSKDTNRSPITMGRLEEALMMFNDDAKAVILDEALTVSSKDLFVKRPRDDKSTDTDSSKAPMFPNPIVSPQSKKIKFDTSATTIAKNEQFMPLASHGYSGDANPSHFAHLSDDLLLPQTVSGHEAKSADMLMDDVAGYAFHILQSSLVARGICKEKMKKNKEFQVEHQGCASRIRKAEEEATKNLKNANDVQKEFDEFATKVQSLELKMQEEARQMATQQIMRTRVEMMLEYQRGEWKSWDIPEMVKIYNETYPEDAFVLEGRDGDAGKDAVDGAGSPVSK
ncbi:hypothetical protein POM88_017771 [Heracleum sosnowskyi]|uniref:Uncharacterized protein n=1 Tax=Heracleum sosnowskyi TaxID=360622 RepID=A0AAD8IRB7_9APIA|nr:hypothetical protein POM88_017771 [Heracleum sosnowskyi]